MKTFSNITWGLFVITAIPVLIVLSSLFALLSLVSTELAAGKDLRSAVQNELLWILPDVLLVDVPYLYMLFKRREKG